MSNPQRSSDAPIPTESSGIETVQILGGHGKGSEKEPVSEITLHMGDLVSVVGPTGSGKTTLINDVALFADGHTPTGRRILINGLPAPEDYLDEPSRNPVAIITQHTNFLSDLPVLEFLHIHATVRHRDTKIASKLTQEVLDFANQLTGEPILGPSKMTELSGGQTRALLIADAVVIGAAPIVLLDEIENAGIHRSRAMQLLRQYRKIFVFVTHDPTIALLTDMRIVMGNGMMVKIVKATAEERDLGERVRLLDDALMGLRNRIRMGENLSGSELLELS